MVTDLEKRLRLLRQQVYGKKEVESSQYNVASENTTTDLVYLHQDLFKILSLSSLAIGAQIVLFFLSKNHILNLNFF